MKRLAHAVLALALAVAAVVVAPAPEAAAAQTLSPRPNMRRIAEAPDFASIGFSNAWDFAGATDLLPRNNLNNFGFSNVRVEGGRWKGTADPQGYLRLLQSWDSLPFGRDGQRVPIDADRFTHISFRMKVDVGAGAEVSWYDCGQMRQECKGAFGFRTEPGWQTYDFAIERDPTRGDVDWAGEIRGLTLLPTARGGDIEIDWIRVYEPTGPGIRFKSRDTDPGAKLIWDKDRLTSNNTPDNPNWGVITTIGWRARYWKTDAMPPGVYYVYTTGTNGQSAQKKITINGLPRPSVISPDATGGLSYDVAVRGDAWDFSQASDVELPRNMNWSIDNGRLVGTNTSPIMPDSSFRVAMDPVTPLDADRFHRVTVRVWYAGNFSLSAAPGGGMNARLVWRKAGGGLNDFKVSEDIVVLPGWNTITIDMADYTSNELLETDHPVAWAGQDIGLFRFDPHEDSGSRQFIVDWIKIAENDKTTNNRFDITFRDWGFERFSTATISIDRDGNGTGKRVIGTVETVERGVNTFSWTVPPSLRGTGTWHVNVEVTDRWGVSSGDYSNGTLDI